MHRERQHRKFAVGGFFAAAVVLATASLAFACVQTIGTLTVTGPNGGVSTAVGNGGHPPRGNYCVAPTNGASAPRATSFADRPAITVAYGPSDLCNPTPRPRANTPSDGTYDVMFCDGNVFRLKNGVWGPVVFPDRGSCFFTDAVSDRAVLMGTMAVAGGSGSGVYRIPFGAAKTGPTNAAGVSVRRTGPGGNPAGGPPDVNMAPISII